MAAKYLRRAFFAVLSFLILYLGTAWIWASSAAPDLLNELSYDNLTAGLDPRHSAALIKIEDPRFYAHGGLDISNGQGLTTITSTVTRMLFLGDHQLRGVKGSLQLLYRGVYNCCKRIDFGRDVMALVLSSHLSKQEQLTIFISRAHLGSLNGRAIIGFENAAVAYYGKKLAELTNDEFLGIVAMLLAPNYYHPIKNPQIHAQRVGRVKAVVSGQCEPDGWLDLTYEHCNTDT